MWYVPFVFLNQCKGLSLVWGNGQTSQNLKESGTILMAPHGTFSFDSGGGQDYAYPVVLVVKKKFGVLLLLFLLFTIVIIVISIVITYYLLLLLLLITYYYCY